MTRERRRSAVEAGGAFAAFCGLGLLSRLVPALFILIVVVGIVFPLVWAWVTKDWASLGFTRRRLLPALAWGFGAGLLGALYVYLSFRGRTPPQAGPLGVQLGIGVFVAFLILSPFQELFFRGWLQPRFQQAVGWWPGLAVTAVGFAVWHLCPPFEGTPTSSIAVSSVGGVLTALGMGLVFGFIFWRTGNIAAPWLGHALMIVGTVAVGALSFVQYGA